MLDLLDSTHVIRGSVKSGDFVLSFGQISWCNVSVNCLLHIYNGKNMESRTTFGSFLPDSSYTKPTIASSSPTIEIGSNEDDPLVQIILSTAWFLIFLCVIVFISLALVPWCFTVRDTRTRVEHLPDVSHSGRSLHRFCLRSSDWFGALVR